MSQHDFDIANQTASNARADINNALKALASTSSGATAPSTTFADQLWYDTANNQLKKRNEANSAWVTLFTINDSNGNLTFAAPSVTNSLTVNTSNTTGQGIVISDDGDIVDMNTGYAAMRFSNGVQIYSAKSGGSPVITLGSDGVIQGNYANALGVNQSWQDVSGSRAVDTWYQNTSSRPIQIAPWTTGGNGRVDIGVSTGSYVSIRIGDLSSGSYDMGFLIIPPNYYYRVADAPLANMWELR